MIRVVVMSAPMLSSLIRNLHYVAPPGVTVQAVDAFLDDSVRLAREIEAAAGADVFVSAGANARLLAGAVTRPLVEISVTGFDILTALKRARSFADRVAVFAYPEQLEHLRDALPVLSMQVTPVAYEYDLAQVERRMDELLAAGIRTVVGSSLVLQTARRRTMDGVFIYSDDSVKRALDHAVQLALANRQEIEKAKALQTILDFTHGGIIATDRDGVVRVFNPAAAKITGIAAQSAVGQPVARLFPHTRLAGLLHQREPELNQLQSVGGRRVVTSTIPIFVEGTCTGAVVTLGDVASIQEAEATIRKKLYTKGFVSRRTFEDIHGTSAALRQAKAQAGRYAGSDATVTILGESGTGKELFARAIHAASPRAREPFVVINCAAFPENLLESELFGYDEGAFTGARRGGKQGLIELAHGGTLFLDEIAEMPLSLQARLLRVLEEHEVMHVGGEKMLHVDIRVIAAANRDLARLVEAGRFREDFYYRLNVLVLHVPPLRRRPDDIPLLAALYLAQLLPDLPGRTIKLLADSPCLAAHDWPGNVRELRNCMERFAVLYPTAADPAALLASILRREPLDRDDGADVRRALREAGGNRAAAARKLGISRSTLWRKLRRLSPPGGTP
ncbi:MAG: sigma 54-interacting transcriptional regulator [Candidatus Methylomirabilales bacterium]